MESIGERIRARREQLGWTQAKLSEMLNVKVGTLSGYERNYRIPDARMLQLLSNILKVSSDYLLGLTQQTLNINQKPLPILGTIRAGLPILADENIEGYLDVPEYIRADFVLTVTGDSMIGAGILDGDYVICREAQAANSGQIVVALNDLATGFSEATLKYYFDNGKGQTLRPANPNYPEIEMKDGYRIGGIMVASLRRDAPGYQVYKEYITVPGHDEWTEVIEIANGAGLKVNQVKEILAGQIEIAKKLRG